MRTLIAIAVSLLLPGWMAACSGSRAGVDATSRNDLDVKGLEDCIKNIPVPPTDPQYTAEVEKCIAQFDAAVPIPSFDGSLPGLPDVALPDVSLPDVSLPDVSLPDVGVPSIGDAGAFDFDASFPLPDGGSCRIAFSCQLLSCVCNTGPQKGQSCAPADCAQTCRDGC
jgi:hypothetical protein